MLYIPLHMQMSWVLTLFKVLEIPLVSVPGKLLIFQVEVGIYLRNLPTGGEGGEGDGTRPTSGWRKNTRFQETSLISIFDQGKYSINIY